LGEKKMHASLSGEGDEAQDACAAQLGFPAMCWKSISDEATNLLGIVMASALFSTSRMDEIGVVVFMLSLGGGMGAARPDDNSPNSCRATKRKSCQRSQLCAPARPVCVCFSANHGCNF
jgi:hypothetical protein